MTLSKLKQYALQLAALTADVMLFPFLLVGVICVGGARLWWAWLQRKKTFRPATIPTLLAVQPGLINAYRLQGEEIISYFTSPVASEVHILDPYADKDEEFSPLPGIRIVGWRTPRLFIGMQALGMRESPFPLRELMTTLRMLNYVTDKGVFCIRSMQHANSALCAGLVSAALNVPHVIEIAGNYEMLRRIWGWPFYFQWFGRIPGLRIVFRACNDALLGWPIKHAFCVIGRNKNNYEHAFALGAPVERLTMIRIHLATSFLNLEQRPAPLAGRYMLFVARITTEKFPLDVVSVFAILADRYPDLSLVVIGDGILLPEVKRQVAGMACKERVHILGNQPYDEVIQWTRGAAIAFETYSGSALAEKMICNVPVVAYDVEWMAEVVIDSFSGKLVRFRDIDAAAQACSELLDDPQEARRLAEMGQKLAIAMFDNETITRKENAIFSSALDHVKENYGMAQ
ncbi:MULTISPECIES: glycosyltransferase [unclassified Agrobacterium]|uniref:glycosyltransferase n=1 Tax=unclassified Agrobacterium TaxID=2632611 RepID=UPI00083CA644|nr:MULTISPECIES: glycosyltransferase [unclassified Agrobacterium]AOG12628.1 glycosyl transferases group 1 family protein [Agrobacterium sp. RAC06]